MIDTNYYFYSWLRENLASAIDQQPEKLRATIEITLDITSETNEKIDQDPPSKQIELYGPGDVLGFDSRIVTRTDPGPNVGDFEPNYFPIIEFAEPDFPWRFTPDKEDANDNLQPWIALIVLEDGEFKEEGTNEGDEQSKRPDKQLPPVISEVSTSSLPVLSETWRWAHVQVTDEANKEISDLKLKKIMSDEPERIISRLMCARRLKSGIKYHAFVVPTFRCGISVGLGKKPDEYEKPLSYAWDKNGNKVDLPYYYKWEFRTGQRGDFEHLIRLLKPRPITGVGTRKIKCENLDHISVSDLDLEGALCSPDTVFTQWGKDDNESKFKKRLAEFLNQPKADMTSSTSDTPKVVPPIYGRWHAARNEVHIQDDNINKSWLDELNLDPRHRIAASIGAKVIKDQQESLMVSAWDQLGDVEEANEKLRQAQFGMASSKSIYKRLPQDEDLLRLSAPFFSKVQMENRYTVQEHIQRSMVPLAICDPAFRRIQGPQGPIRKRQKAALNSQRLFERFSKGGHKVVRTHPVYGNIMENQILKDTISTRVYEELDPRKKIIDRNKSILEREDLGIIMVHPTFPQPMYKFMQDISQELLLPGIEKISQNTIGILKTNRRFIEAYMCGLNHAFAAELLWREYPTDQRGSYFRQFWDYSDHMSKDNDTKENLEDIKPLAEWDGRRLGMNKPVNHPEEKLVLILRGDLLKKYPNAVIYAVEAKLKYLFSWDEIPVNDDERIIEFLKDEFKIEWAKTENIRKIDDGKTIIVSNKEKSLSLKLNEEKTKVNLKIDDGRVDEFTVKTKNGKLNIYKNVPALPEFEVEGEMQSPVFSGTLQPDITFLGFNITENDARGKTKTNYPHGFYFVIEERVSETRFGLDESRSENCEEFETWDDITWDHFKKKKVEPGDYLDGLEPDLGDEYIHEWNDGSDNIAWITMQKPVRIIIHANRILP